MSLIDLASLVLAPTAVKDGKVYNAIPNDQDFTFSRGTEATRVNSAGLIEKARTNLLLQSNTFDTTWTTGGLSETSGQSGYDGSSDAWLVENVAGGSRFMTQTGLGLGVATCSIYAKAGTTDWIYFNNGAGVSAYYDLTNGVLGTTSGVIDANIESIGSGWYRCSMTASSMNEVRYYLADSNNSLPTSIGDNVYFQDAQLEQGLISTDVITTTTSSVTVGVTDDLPRVDYSGGGCPSLLLEPSRTQLLVNSEYANSTDWNNGGTTYENNSSTSPEGVDNAIKVSEDTSTAFHYLGSQKTGVSTAGDYTISGFIKKGSRRYAGLRGVTNGFVNRYFVLLDLNDGSVVDTNTFGSGVTWSHNVSEYANGWYRIEITGGHTSGTIDATFGLSDSDSPSYTGGLPVYNGVSGEHIFGYGLMLEAGSYVSSYIPTYGTSVTRGVDIVDGAVDSNLFNDDEGVLFIEFAALADTRDNDFRFLICDGTNNERIQIFLPTSNILNVDCIVSNSATANITYTLPNPSSNHKVAFKYKNNDFALWVDGVERGTDTSGATPSGLDRLDFYRTPNNNNYVEANVKQTIYFNTALTDTQLQELTK